VSQTVQHRYRALDGLWGIAALFVVFYHAPWLTHFSDARMVKNAYLPVDFFFFVLSGFVIATNYARRIVDLESASVVAWRFCKAC
jgi:peptidoglycan/LPS O-acetylase OafA/YrhL